MNERCFIKIADESYPGTLLGVKEKVYDVKMAGPNGYQWVIDHIDHEGKVRGVLQMIETDVVYNFTCIVVHNQDANVIVFKDK